MLPINALIKSVQSQAVQAMGFSHPYNSCHFYVRICTSTVYAVYICMFFGQSSLLCFLKEGTGGTLVFKKNIKEEVVDAVHRSFLPLKDAAILNVTS